MGRGHQFNFFYEWSELEKVTGECNVYRLHREKKKWAELTGPRSPKWAEVTGPRSLWAEVTCILLHVHVADDVLQHFISSCTNTRNIKNIPDAVSTLIQIQYRAVFVYEVMCTLSVFIFENN